MHQLSGICDTIPLTGDQPTLMELIRLRRKERCVNIPQQIGTNFMNFGILLLEDEWITDQARYATLLKLAR